LCYLPNKEEDDMSQEEQPVIRIDVVGTTGVGKSTIAFLLADFLTTTGFKTELNLLDDLDMDLFEATFTDKLEALERRNTRFIVNEVQAKSAGVMG